MRQVDSAAKKLVKSLQREIPKANLKLKNSDEYDEQYIRY
jgi:hypothetical protein